MKEKELLNSCNAYRRFFAALLDEVMEKLIDPAATLDADTREIISETKGMLTDCAAITLMLFKGDLLEQRINALTRAEIKLIDALQEIEKEDEPDSPAADEKMAALLNNIMNKLKKPN